MVCEPALRTFVMLMVGNKVDYATAYGRACGSIRDADEIENFDNKFDYLWDHYHDLRSLQNSNTE